MSRAKIIRQGNGKNGYTLLEMCVTLVIISITAAIFFPIVTKCPDGKPQQAVCASNLKQIGVAALMYAQDYDETLPPAVSADKVFYAVSGMSARRFGMPPHVPRPLPFKVHFWLGQSEMAPMSQHDFPGTGGFLQAYLKSEAVCRCPEKQTVGTSWNTEQYGYKTTYMTNDLLSGAKKSDVVNPVATVLAMDGETSMLTIGHAFEASKQKDTEQRWNQTKTQITQGAAVNQAATRHKGGANYLLADGHMRWFKPQDVFFPPRESTSHSHLDQLHNKMVGPNPFGTMEFDDGPHPEGGFPYKATFHLR